MHTVVFGKIAGGEAATLAKELGEGQKSGTSLLGSKVINQKVFDIWKSS